MGIPGHEGRDAGTDIALVEAANKAGISHHELAAHAMGKSGRHMMDSLPASAQVEPGKEIGKQALAQKHAQRVEHFHKWMTNPQTEKDYHSKEWAKELEDQDRTKKLQSGEHEVKPVEQAKPAEPAAPKSNGIIAQEKIKQDSDAADAATAQAHKLGTAEAYQKAGEAHMAAQDSHSSAPKREYHSKMADQHFADAKKLKAEKSKKK
jgi:hypothetical protein